MILRVTFSSKGAATIHKLGCLQRIGVRNACNMQRTICFHFGISLFQSIIIIEYSTKKM